MASNKQFKLQIDKFVRATGLRADIVVRKIGFDLYAEVLRRSPVDTGRFRASWRIGVQRADLSIEPPRSSKPEAQGDLGSAPTGAEMAVATSKLASAKFSDTLFITNNVIYAGRLEYGHSRQAPRGVMRVSVAHVVREFNKTVKSVLGT